MNAINSVTRPVVSPTRPSAGVSKADEVSSGASNLSASDSKTETNVKSFLTKVKDLFSSAVRETKENLAPSMAVIEAPGYGISTTTKVNSALSLVHSASVCIEKAIHALGIASGVVSILDGIRDVVSAARCYSRAQKVEACLLKVEAFQAAGPKESADSILVNDLKAALETSKTVLKERSVDKAIVGCINIAVGIVGVVANIATLGLAAPIVGLIAWGSGQAVKTCLRAYRTHTSPPQEKIDSAVKVLKQCQQAVKNEGSAFSGINVNSPLKLIDLQRGICTTMRIAIAKPSPDQKPDTDQKPDKGIDKFTKNSATFRLNINEKSTKFEQAVAVCKAALLLVT